MLILITCISVAVSLVAVTLAWLTVREERRRSEARVAALADASAPQSDALPDEGAWLEWPPRDEGAPRPIPAAAMAPAPASNEETRILFSGGASAPSAPRRLAPVVIGALVVVGALLALIMASRGGGPATAVSGAPRPAALELVSLTHARKGDELTVTGLVRNPAGGAPIEAAHAVVFLFDAQSRFLTSARAPLEVRALAPGDESPFRVTIAAPPDLGRYRVSFRRAEGALVPHVDRRAAAVDPLKRPAGSTAPAPLRRAGL